MEEKQLIERRSLNGNRRTSYIFLTEQGTQSQQLIDGIFAQIEAQAFQGIPEAEREKWMRQFRQIYENLCQADA